MSAVDVLVVGAGPAGSTVAERLARQGHHVRLVEEHPRVGDPVQCAGLVSNRVLALARDTSFVRRPVRGATVLAPSLAALRFAASEPRAFVIDREALDVALAAKARGSGAEVTTGTKFEARLSSTPEETTCRLVNETEGTIDEVRARIVVGADGVSSAVARAYRLRRPVEILPAFEAEFQESPGDPDQVEVYLGNSVAPGLFGWWIPDGNGGARIGVAVRAGRISAREYFQRLLQQIERRAGRPLDPPHRYIVSGIPIGNVPSTSGDHVLLVGDAAAQVKPLSGGGIYTGMRCAEIAAEVIDRALHARDSSNSMLRTYDQAWRAEFGEEFRRALYLRRVLVRLSDEELESVVRSLQASELTASIVAFGDIDFPSHVARRLLRQSPSLLRLFPKAVRALWDSSGTAPDLEPGPFRQAM